ncbi:hypothetical protein ADUPG1_010029, partial [Aduncisulcus paluster]
KKEKKMLRKSSSSKLCVCSAESFPSFPLLPPSEQVKTPHRCELKSFFTPIYSLLSLFIPLTSALSISVGSGWTQLVKPLWKDWITAGKARNECIMNERKQMIEFDTNSLAIIGELIDSIVKQNEEDRIEMVQEEEEEEEEESSESSAAREEQETLEEDKVHKEPSMVDVDGEDTFKLYDIPYDYDMIKASSQLLALRSVYQRAKWCHHEHLQRELCELIIGEKNRGCSMTGTEQIEIKYPSFREYCARVWYRVSLLHRSKPRISNRDYPFIHLRTCIQPAVSVSLSVKRKDGRGSDLKPINIPFFTSFGWMPANSEDLEAIVFPTAKSADHHRKTSKYRKKEDGSGNSEIPGIPFVWTPPTDSLPSLHSQLSNEVFMLMSKVTVWGVVDRESGSHSSSSSDASEVLPIDNLETDVPPVQSNELSSLSGCICRDIQQCPESFRHSPSSLDLSALLSSSFSLAINMAMFDHRYRLSSFLVDVQPAYEFSSGLKELYGEEDTSLEMAEIAAKIAETERSWSVSSISNEIPGQAALNTSDIPTSTFPMSPSALLADQQVSQKTNLSAPPDKPPLSKSQLIDLQCYPEAPRVKSGVVGIPVPVDIDVSLKVDGYYVLKDIVGEFIDVRKEHDWKMNERKRKKEKLQEEKIERMKQSRIEFPTASTVSAATHIAAISGKVVIQRTKAIPRPEAIMAPCASSGLIYLTPDSNKQRISLTFPEMKDSCVCECRRLSWKMREMTIAEIEEYQNTKSDKEEGEEEKGKEMVQQLRGVETKVSTLLSSSTSKHNFVLMKEFVPVYANFFLSTISVHDAVNFVYKHHIGSVSPPILRHHLLTTPVLVNISQSKPCLCVGVRGVIYSENDGCVWIECVSGNMDRSGEKERIFNLSIDVKVEDGVEINGEKGVKREVLELFNSSQSSKNRFGGGEGRKDEEKDREGEAIIDRIDDNRHSLPCIVEVAWEDDISTINKLKQYRQSVEGDSDVKCEDVYTALKRAMEKDKEMSMSLVSNTLRGNDLSISYIPVGSNLIIQTKRRKYSCYSLEKVIESEEDINRFIEKERDVQKWTKMLFPIELAHSLT